jgi:multidrug transporter EmrE-like cation transporter
MDPTKTTKKVLPIALIFVTTLIQASATAMIKYGMALMKANPADRTTILVFAVAMLLYCASFPIYTFCLSKLKLSVAQPVVSGSMFLYTILISILFFKESLALYKIAGFAAIIGGIVIVVI